MLTHKDINEKIRGCIAPLTRQLQEWTRLVQGMTTTRHTNHYLGTEFSQQLKKLPRLLDQTWLRDNSHESLSEIWNKRQLHCINV